MATKEPQVPAKLLIEAQERLQESVAVLSQVEQKLEQADTQIEYVQEAYTDAVRSMLAQEDVGWTLLGGHTGHGFDLAQLHSVSHQLREWTDTNPLLARGIEIRCSYLFGAGYEIVKKSSSVGRSGDTSDIQPRFKKIIEDPANQEAVFSRSALSIAEKARYTDGQHFALYDSKRARFQRVPFDEIADAFYNPDDPEEVWYYLRRYTRMIRSAEDLQARPIITQLWYKTDTNIDGPDYTSIAGFDVVPNVIIIDHRVNRTAGRTFGRPDAFPASPWALAYSAYLRDGTKVLSALAEWAWKLSPKTKAGGAAAKGRMAEPEARVAGKTAITDMDMVALPKGNAVDLSTGRPLAAQVAAAIGVSVVLLLADPGQSGSYGTAQTLSDPTIKTMTFRQDDDGEFLVRCLRAIGLNDAEIVWGKMATDADYREMQTLAILWDTGLFQPETIQSAMAKLSKLGDVGQVPDGILVPNNAVSDAQIDIQTQLVKILAKAEAQLESGQPAPGSTTPAPRASKASTVSKVNGVGAPGGTAGAVSAANNDLRDAAKKK